MAITVFVWVCFAALLSGIDSHEEPRASREASRVSREASRVSREASRMSREASRVSRGTPRMNRGASRVSRLADRVHVLEVRFDADSKFQREDIWTLMNKIDTISGMLNVSAEEAQCHEQKVASSKNMLESSSLREISDVCTNWRRDFKQLTVAFKDEKLLNKKIRDHFPDVADRTNTAVEAMVRVDETLIEVTENIRGVADDTKTVVNETNANQIKLTELVHEMTELKNELLEVKESCTSKPERPKSCAELYEKGYHISGQYDVYPEGRLTPIRVFCDQDTDGGGWTVFQRREDGSEDFYRGWLDYKLGFGNLDGEFWLGNEYISILTSTCCHRLRIDMKSFEEENKHAAYSVFQLKSKNEKYSLKISGYSGDAGDSLSGHNGAKFSTKDRDNDIYGSNCAVSFKGAWWYTKCHSSNLNGFYYDGKHQTYADGVNWQAWKGYHYSLKFTEMKFK